MGKAPKKTRASKPKTKTGGAASEKPMTSKAQQIGADDLKNLLRRCSSWKKQGSEVTGQIGEAIAKAAENKNLDKKAFSIVRALASMTEQKRLTTLACLDYYVDVLELDKSEQADADLGRPEAGRPQGQVVGEPGSNVQPLRQPASAEA